MYYFKFWLQSSPENMYDIINIDTNMPTSTTYQILKYGNLNLSLLRKFMLDHPQILKFQTISPILTFSINNIVRTSSIEVYPNSQLIITCHFHEIEDFTFHLESSYIQLKVTFKKPEIKSLFDKSDQMIIDRTQNLSALQNVPRSSIESISTMPTKTSMQAIDQSPDQILKDEVSNQNEIEAFQKLLDLYQKQNQDQNHILLNNLANILQKLNDFKTKYFETNQQDTSTIESLILYLEQCSNQNEFEKLSKKLKSKNIKLIDAIKNLTEIIQNIGNSTTEINMSELYNKLLNFIKDIWQNQRKGFDEINHILSDMGLALIIPKIDHGETFDIKYHKIAKRQSRSPGQLARQIIEIASPGLIISQSNEVLDKASVVIAE